MPTVRDLLDPHTLAVKLATGYTPGELYDRAALGLGPVKSDPQHPDRAVHALAAHELALRTTPALASLVGLGKETMQGLGQLATGRSFYGEHGLDENDLIANETGIQQVEDERRWRAARLGNNVAALLAAVSAR